MKTFLVRGLEESFPPRSICCIWQNFICCYVPAYLREENDHLELAVEEILHEDNDDFQQIYRFAEDLRNRVGEKKTERPT